MKEAVEKVITRIRPLLQRDGGDIELVEVEGNIVKVKLTGACRGCPMAAMTLKNHVERILKEAVPTIQEVIAE